MVRRVELEVKSFPYKLNISKISRQDAREIGFGWHELL